MKLMKLHTRFITTLPGLALSLVLVGPLHAQRPAVEAKNGMVTSAHELASRAGVDILKQGGNAVDAAAATGLALAVVFPEAGNIGGGGFMLIHLADGRDTVIDYRETAPAAATRDMYVGPDGHVLEGPGSSVVGWRASGVPGTVAGFAQAVEKYGSGKVKWSDIVAPAIRLAESQTVTQGLADGLRANAEFLGRFPSSKKYFLVGGKFLQTGDTWVQADLAATLTRIARDPRDFYTGETARLIAGDMKRHGGSITAADLAAYRPAERKPIRSRYRGHDILTMPPPSSGGIALTQMLGMIEPHDVRALGHNSAAKYHLFAEVMKRAFRDRAEYLGDPDYVKIPVEKLLDPAYIRNRMADYSPDRATPAAQVKPGLGDFDTENITRRESKHTTHFCVIDAAGNAVSNTYTLNYDYGSGNAIEGAGFLMNNEMDDFTAKVGVPNIYGLLQGEANAIAPGKRPLSSMTPTIVLKDGKILLATGSPGGPTIINTVFQIVTNVIDHQMPVMQAVEAPRINNQWMPDRLFHERYGLSPDTMAILKAKGHDLKEGTPYDTPYQGDGETIGVDRERGLLQGASDPRSPDSKAVGY
ncbi:hypothetical protein AW736_23130 [Termitidicoccus mucosus]|uniref:Glutathione hydrolase proenzyme n=2 Tax=Termitidicoccus mucosus TaxID=1184151 RepID=A0A178IEF5_9BACT|nr:hypothetical protein AW736_23130 [Opitutaceae bacterium TSB47]